MKRALAGPAPRPEPPSPDRPDQSNLETIADADSALPFLLPDPEPPELSGTSEVSLPAPPPAEEPESPRLARGLASFSRSNADREKKFAHLLRDDAPADKKKPPA